MRRVSIIGAGTIGASWAAYFLARGYEVAGYDPAPNGETFARRFIDTAWPTLESLNVVQAGADRKRFEFFKDPAAATKGAEFIQESGPEREDLKIELFATLDAALPPDVVIATSSSGLLISRVSTKCKHPERCVIGHPFNPPHLIPLVEVVGGVETSPDAISKAMQFYRDIGKYPIHIKKEVRGHVANRLQVALWREAVHLVAEGVVSVADADAAIAYGPGLRWALMGPILTFHLAGGTRGMSHMLDHFGAALLEPWTRLQAPPLTEELRERLVQGCLRQARGRSVAQLEGLRDEFLAGLLSLSEPFADDLAPLPATDGH